MLAPPSLEKRVSSNTQEEVSYDYEAALMSNMLHRMKSSITQKMMGVVEQERALMLEQ